MRLNNSGLLILGGQLTLCFICCSDKKLRLIVTYISPTVYDDINLFSN